MPAPAVSRVMALRLTCLRCGYAPDEVYAKPWKRCPECRSPYWHTARGVLKRGRPAKA